MLTKLDLSEKKKSFILAAAIAFAALFICINIMKSHAGKREAVRGNIKDFSRRIALRKDIEKIDKIQQGYTKYFYDDIDQQALRAIITGLANESNVNIMAMKALSREQVGAVSKEMLDVSLRCTYNQLGVFISKIENLKNTTRIESLSIESAADFRSQAGLSGQDQKKLMDSDTMVSVYMVIAGYSI
jgi:cell division FtsZ-interacting protein ZapD